MSTVTTATTRAHGTKACPECGTERGVVSVAQFEVPPAARAMSGPPLELAAAQQEVARLQGELRTAEAHLRSLTASMP